MEAVQPLHNTSIHENSVEISEIHYYTWAVSV